MNPPLQFLGYTRTRRKVSVMGTQFVINQGVVRPIKRQHNAMQ